MKTMWPHTYIIEIGRTSETLKRTLEIPTGPHTTFRELLTKNIRLS